MTCYPTLFSPLQIKSMTLKNRVVMSPIGSNFALESGEMSREHLEYYRLRAAGGVGLIIMENVCVDYPKGSNGTTQLRMDQDRFLPPLYVFNETMHKYGCCTSVQLNHGGCAAVPARIGGAAVSASAIPLADGSYTQALSAEKIEHIAKQFGRAAARAKQAGFDSVEIHAGHGYLINQFLSPTWNHRTDEFGGSIENRARFCRMVVDEVRRAVGEDYPVLMRFSMDEFTQTGNHLEDSLALLELLKDGVDLLDASVGGTYAMDVAQMADGWHAYLAGAAKRHLAMPCAIMGNIRDPQTAEDILTRGDGDLIVIGRGLLADPQWPLKAQRGDLASIRPCISCNIGCVTHRAMLNQPIRCTVNPSLTTEEWHKQHTVKGHCNVVVIGGGVSGLEAACTAAETGCRVTLLEARSELGGWLTHISRLPNKARLKQLLDYMRNRAQRLKNLTCLTNTAATQALIDAFKPDLVVWSAGSAPLLPPIQGLEEQLGDPAGTVYDLSRLFENLDFAGSITGMRVGVAGGGAAALDLAEYFAQQENQVFVVEQRPAAGQGLDPFTQRYISRVFEAHKVELYLSHKLESVTSNCFRVSDGAQTHSLPFDYAFICLGLRPNVPPAGLQAYLAQQGIPLLSIGDSAGARRIYEGIQEGRNIVETLKTLGFYE